MDTTIVPSRETETVTPPAEPTTPAAPETGKKGNGKANGKAAPKPKPAKKAASKPAAPKKPPVYGGVSGSPSLGANGRRLWAFLRENLSQADQRKIRAEVLKNHPEGDRFIRWEHIVSAAEKTGIKVGKGEAAVEINGSLVRKLATVKGAKQAGLKTIEFEVK